MFKSQFLLEVLNEQVGGNLVRIKCLSNLILGVIQCRSVNLTHLASHQSTTAKHASEYRKLQRFFEQWWSADNIRSGSCENTNSTIHLCKEKGYSPWDPTRGKQGCKSGE